MSDKIIIVDFEDSFTYNIASVLFPFEERLKVVPHRDFFASYFSHALESQDKKAIILGPGPGHPNEFRDYFSLIERIRDCESVYLMGICLGHQILGLMDNKCIRDSLEKVHGQSVEVDFQGRIHQVQRYNSLSVFENNESIEELNVRKFVRGVSYQFHPESIGTINSKIFFDELLSFIHS